MQKPKEVKVYNFWDVEVYLYKKYGFEMEKFWELVVAPKLNYDPDWGKQTKTGGYFILTDRDLYKKYHPYPGEVVYRKTECHEMIWKILEEFNQQETENEPKFVKFIIHD